MSLIACSILSAFGAEQVRQRFVPAKAGAASSRNGASFSRLVAGPLEHGGLLLHAHAGIGDSFPVRQKENETLFEVFVADGDDDHFVLEIRSKEGIQKLDAKPDKPVEAEVAGIKYLFSFPSVSMAPTSNPTTDPAMIMVIQR